MTSRVLAKGVVRSVGHLFLVMVVLLACHACGGSGGSGPQTQPGPPSSFPPGCGMSLFSEPECEAVLDRLTCSQQDQCAHDVGCMRIVQCWDTCEAQRKVASAREGGRTGAGCECFPNCFPQLAHTPGYVPFMSIIALTQGNSFDGTKCRSGC